MASSFHIHLARGIITYLLSQAKTLPLVKSPPGMGEVVDCEIYGWAACIRKLCHDLIITLYGFMFTVGS